MKLLLLTLSALFIFSGCSTKSQNYRLRTKNAQQYAMIKQQENLIKVLQAKLKFTQTSRTTMRAGNARKNRINTIQNSNTLSNMPLPKASKKVIKLKKVEDSNYSSTYMYPGGKKKVAKEVSNVVTAPKRIKSVKVTASTMTKTECISMIGADKFDKYTSMFGSEAASLKRCKMLKAMKQ